MEAKIDALAYGPEEACRLLGVGRTTLFGLLKTGEIPSFQIGGRRLIRHADLAAFVEGKVKNAA